eukprot:scpid90068/ scgid24195/ 
MKGSSGPSGVDADGWCRMLTSYKAASDHLCRTLALAAQCLCTEAIPASDVSAFTASRLIPLAKKPSGVRPIAVGEVFRRLIGRAVMSVIKPDVLRAVAPLQLCVGVPSACEAAVHAMRKIFNRDDTEAILFVDATNAFNSLNRTAALHNIPRICPALGKIFQNTYSDKTRLFVAGGGEVLSQEGTCQGDPLAMAYYAVATVPLVQRLQEANPDVDQEWYADDDAAGGDISSLASYWKDVNIIGPEYGYNPNPTKTTLLVKPQYLDRAEEVFQGTGVCVTAAGHQYLGGIIGDEDYCHRVGDRYVSNWRRELMNLTAMAEMQPQAAYTVLTKGLSSKWSYHLRASLLDPVTLAPADEVLGHQLLPALLSQGMAADSSQRQLLSLPTRFGGLAIPMVAKSAEAEHAPFDVRVTDLGPSLLSR